MKYSALVYIEPGTNYYSRWTFDRRRTHKFSSDEALTPYWIEVLRASPDIIDMDALDAI